MLNERIFLTLLLVLVSILTISNNWMHRIDEIGFEIGQEWFAESRRDNLALIKIDPDDLARYGSWPWARNIQAELLEKICEKKPKVIVLNISYATNGDAINDQILANQIKACGNVVLPVTTEESIFGALSKETLPIELFAKVAQGIGKVGVRSAKHGGGYGVDVYEGVGTPAWPIIAKVALEIAGKKENRPVLTEGSISLSQNPYKLAREDFRLIHHGQAKVPYEYVSASNIMDNLVPYDSLNNRIVVLGLGWNEGDHHGPVKTSLNDNGLLEVESIADLVVKMQKDKLIAPLAESTIYLTTIFLAIIPVLLVTNLSPLVGLMSCGLWIGLILIGSSILSVTLQIWMPPSGIILASILAYPIWSWRRLEASQRYLDWQLRQLVGDEREEGMRKLGYEKRISTVQIAQARYKELQSQRDEMLAFFSHDIRAPLAIVASQITGSDLPDSVKQRLVFQLSRAHDLAQGFLSLIRAQSIARSTFEDVDLIAILHQSVDGFYEKSRQLKVVLVRKLPDDPIWIKGDFGLLQRAFENLLGNALKYAPSYSEVLIRVEFKDGKKVVSVLDSGPGVSPDLVSNLFKKFSTHGQDKDGVKGNGLGLYFVHTVAQNHDAECGYSARSPHGAHFWIAF